MRKKGGEKVSIFVIVKQWINCESLLCEVILEMSSLIAHSHPQQKGRKWKDREVGGRMVLLTESRIIALQTMSVWHIMHTHYVSISSNNVANDDRIYCRWTAAISTAHCIPLVVSMWHNIEDEIQASIGLILWAMQIYSTDNSVLTRQIDVQFCS